MAHAEGKIGFGGWLKIAFEDLVAKFLEKKTTELGPGIDVANKSHQLFHGRALPGTDRKGLFSSVVGAVLRDPFNAPRAIKNAWVQWRLDKAIERGWNR